MGTSISYTNSISQNERNGKKNNKKYSLLCEESKNVDTTNKFKYNIDDEEANKMSENTNQKLTLEEYKKKVRDYLNKKYPNTI